VRLDAELSRAGVLQGSIEGSFQLVESLEAGGRRFKRSGSLVGKAREAPETDVVVLRAGGEEELARGDIVGD
jgi:hypothetical protein